MFYVTAEFDVGSNDWEDFERKLAFVAGRPGDERSFFSTPVWGRVVTVRSLVWRVDGFNEALEMKKRLNLLPGVRATLRES
jgi:hypothetical protein